MHKTRIIIADNCKDFVWLLVEFFSMIPNIEIIGVAYDGYQAFEMIEQTKPDAVLLDLIMPDMDGMQVIRRIHACHIPLKIFVISAIGNDSLIEGLTKLGVKRYFIKPIDLNEVASAVLDGN